MNKLKRLIRGIARGMRGWGWWIWFKDKKWLRGWRPFCSRKMDEYVKMIISSALKHLQYFLLIIAIATFKASAFGLRKGLREYKGVCLELRCRGYWVPGWLVGISRISDVVDKRKLTLVWIWSQSFFSFFFFLPRGPRLEYIAEKKERKEERRLDSCHAFFRPSFVGSS